MGEFACRGRRVLRIGGAVALLGVTLPVLASVDVAHAAIKTWDGGGGDSNWSTALNWTDDIAPQTGDALVFPTTANPAANKPTNNDFAPGTLFASVTILEEHYLMGGNGPMIPSLSITANGYVGIGWADIVVPPAGLVETISANADVNQGIPIAIGANAVTYDVDGTLTSAHIFSGTAAGASVTRTGSGTIKLTAGSGPELPWAIESGTTYFNANNQFGANVTQTGGIVGGQNGNLFGLTVDGGVFSPGNDVFAATQMVVNGATDFNAGGTYQVDLVDAGNYDRLFANGSVAVGGTLTIVAGAFVPAGNQSFTIIQNDDTDPVVGTFSGLPQGATVTVNGVDMTISYTGGSGNDVTLSTPFSFAWDGGAADDNWTSAANWVGDVAPVGNANEGLEFGPSAEQTAANDFPVGTSFRDIAFTTSGYTLSGNRVAVSGAISGSQGGGTNAVNLAVELTGGGTISVATPGAGLVFGSDLAADGGVITFSGNGYVSSSAALINDAELVQPTGAAVLTAGSGSLILTGNSPAFAGPITNNGRYLQITGTLGQAQVVVHGGQLAVGGSIDGLLADGGTIFPGQQMAPGVMSATSDATIGAGSTLQVDADGPVVGTGYDQLAVTGTVSLGGALSVVSAGGPPVGADLVIISNDGADPVIGTFAGLPEGATISVNGIPLTISYVGGTGNDVVLSQNVAVWDGGGVGAAWTTAANWVGDVAPIPSSSLSIVFPDVALQKANNNDFPGPTPFKDILLTGSGYNLTGARPALAGGVIASNTTGTNTLTFQVDLDGDSTFSQAAGGELVTSSTILFSSSTLTLAGDGTFRLNGQISGTDVDKTGAGLATFATSPTFSGRLTVTQGNAQLGGNIPAEVVVDGGALTGDGAVGGGISANGNGAVAPGSATKGVLTTSLFAAASSTATTGFDVDGTSPGTTQDQLVVNGPVTLAGFLSISATTPVIGTPVVLIANDGADPVAGTFAGVPEGGTVLVNGTLAGVVSYVGGTGNDVTLFIPPTFTWDGGGADSKWSTAANWQGDVAPTGAGGETLVFPPGMPQTANQNDIAGADFDAIRFTGSGYVLAGIGIDLADGVTATNVSGSNTFVVPTTAVTDLTVAQTAGGSLNVGTTVNLGGGVLHVVGAGAHTGLGQVVNGDIDISAVGSGSATITASLATLAGTVFLNSGLLVVNADLVPDVQVAGGRLEGTGGAGGIVATGGAVAPGGATTAVLDSTAALDLDAGSTFEVDLVTTTPGTGHDQIATTGNVSLGATLAIAVSGVVAPGDQFMIVDNGSANAVSGTFAGLADGAAFAVGGVAFTIDYQGGDGNDVVLTAGPNVALSTVAVAVAEGGPGASTSAGLSVVLDAAVAGDVVVHVAITGGSATPGVDVSALGVDVTIPGGATSAPVPLNVLGDDTVEPDETAQVTLAIVSGAILAAPSVATVTITNDDAATITVPNANVVITEGGPGSMGLGLAAVSQLELVLDHPSSTDIGVHVATADGTATAPADYAAFDQIVTIPAGATSLIVALTIVDDDLDEPDETFTVRFLGATGATLNAADVTVTLVDNDQPVVIPTTQPGGPGVTPPATTPGTPTTVDPGSLPATGGSPNRILWTGVALLGIGLVLFAIRRRRTLV